MNDICESRVNLFGSTLNLNDMSFAEKVIHFFDKIESPQVPEYIEVMNPFITEEVRDVVDQFYAKYFNDNNPRRLIFGINPGRFGAGITGVPFTDPIRLEEVCNIPNSFHKRQETSSVFVYNFIEKYGGPEAFYKDYFIRVLSRWDLSLKAKTSIITMIKLCRSL